MTNYIPDVNRFQLAGPPQWWLRGLWDFDDSLVVIPSRQGFFYRLAQRRRLKLSDNIVNDALFAESDTKMLARYSLVPVTTILATAHWNPEMFEMLRQRAPWRLGGAEKVNQMLEDQDTEHDHAKQTKTDEHLAYLGKDAWRLYNKKIGLRSHMWAPTVKRPPQAPTAPASTMSDTKVGIFIS